MKKMIYLLISLLILLSIPAFAEKWIYVGRVSDPMDYFSMWHGGSPYNFYVDADSVVKSGNRLVYWYKLILDNPADKNDFSVEKAKDEVYISSKKYRTLEVLHITPSGAVLSHNTTAGDYGIIEKGDYTDQCIKVALKYAKKAKYIKQ